MHRARAILALAAAMLAAAPLAAAVLTVTKTATVVSDQVSTLQPRALPGATIDYRLLVANPFSVTPPVVRSTIISDDIAPSVKLRVDDLGAAGSGPVEFSDNKTLGLGLINSGLAYSFAGLGSTTDGLEFYDGTSWGYVPVPDASGCDPNVRKIRVTLTGTHAAWTSIQLRYRVAVR